MDRELVKDWIAALRSGEYRQGHGQLRYQPGIEYGEEQYAYCCLGVAADVAINTGKLDARWDGRRYTAPRCLTQSLTLPDGVLPLFGLTGNNQDILVAMNDEENKSFTEIADYIETYYLGNEKGEAA